MYDDLEPTESQLEYVEDICKVLRVEEPECFTRKCYSDFISEYKDKLYNERARLEYTRNQYIFWR